MILSRRTVVALGLAMGLVAQGALAGERATYTPAGFEAAQKAGKPILVEVHASWCPVCKAQAPILSGLRAEPRFKDLTVFTVDFDAQKDALKSFGVTKQSTLIVFKGAKEMGRSTGDTQQASLEGLLAKSL